MAGEYEISRFERGALKMAAPQKWRSSEKQIDYILVIMKTV
jgi:hypothetical protein